MELFAFKHLENKKTSIELKSLTNPMGESNIYFRKT